MITKCRVWDKHKKCWTTDIQYPYTKPYPSKGEGIKDEYFDYIIHWFTGFEDIDGTEIYQGDIVTCSWVYPDNEHYVIVTQYGTHFAAGLDIFKEEGVNIMKKWTGNCWYKSSLNASFTAGPNVEFKVVGNVCEHPELLK